MIFPTIFLDGNLIVAAIATAIAFLSGLAAYRYRRVAAELRRRAAADRAATEFERERSNKLLQTREREFRSLAENLPDLIARHAPDGRIIYINPAFEASSGVALRDVAGKTPSELSNHEAHIEYQAFIEGVARTGSAAEMETFLPSSPTRKASYREIRAVPERDENGDIVGVLTIGRDITRYKRTEEALYLNADKFRSLAENIPDNLIRYDRECRQIYANRRAEEVMRKLLGRNPFGERPNEAYPDGSFDCYEKTLRRVIATGGQEDFELVLPDTGDGVRFHMLRMAAEINAADEVVGAVVIGRDITALKEAERNLLESRAQLRELSSQREAAREEENKRIARDLHEELGQWLVILRMNIAMLPLQYGDGRPGLQEKSLDLLALVDKTIQGMRDTVDALRPPSLDVGIAVGLEWLAHDFARRTGIQCRLHLPEEKLNLDEGQTTAVFRIVQEALANVVRHAGASRVNVQVGRDNGYWLMGVRDNGHSFDPEELNGKSFGIRNMQERARMLGGEFGIVALPGHSTLVTLRFPATEATSVH